MKRKDWRRKSDSTRFTAIPFIKKHYSSSAITKTSKPQSACSNSAPKHSSPSSSSPSIDLSVLPYDVLVRIAASFTLPNLRAASLVCRAWWDAIKPLREAMDFFLWGKRFKHGRGGVKANLSKALDSFLKAAARGSTMAMVDAGLMYWEMGKREEAIVWYRRAAEFGDLAGGCNLAIAFLQADPPNTKAAIEWLSKASIAGHARAQYQLALCLRQGRGVKQSLQQAAQWYLRAAKGGYARGMYNTSVCYSLGEGLQQSDRLARKWMMKAANHGHSKAQFEKGLALFSEGDMINSAVYLELATRAGERAAAHVKDTILQQLSVTSRNRVILLADKWRALPSAR